MNRASSNSRDVVIIGGGISGLTTAGLLSRAGLSVAVLEAQPKAGGCLQGFNRGGFTFDTAIQWINGLGSDGFVRRILNHVGPDYPRGKPLQRFLRYRSPTYDYLLDDDPDRLRDHLTREYPTQAEGLRRLFADGRKLAERLQVMHWRMRAPETMNLGSKFILGLKMLPWYLPVRWLLHVGAEEGLARYINEPQILKIFRAEERLASILVPIAWSYNRDFFAPPAGGCQTWVSWLVRQIEASGSEVKLGSQVDRVLLDTGRAAGVVTAQGETIRSRWIIAACDVQDLYDRMLPPDSIPTSLKKRLQEADIYYSHISLFIGLDCEAQHFGFGEEIVRLSVDGVTREDHSSGDPHRTILNILAPSVRDPSLAPAGKGTLTIHSPAWLEHHGYWKTGPGLSRDQGYREFKQEYARILIDRIAQVLAPSLPDHIELLEIATPVTFWRYTLNRAGSIMGGRPTARNIRNRIAHYRTPIPGLLLGGHWAEYGGGIPLAIKAAANTSLMVLKQVDRKEFLRLRDVVDCRI